MFVISLQNADQTESITLRTQASPNLIKDTVNEYIRYMRSVKEEPTLRKTVTYLQVVIGNPIEVLICDNVFIQSYKEIKE